MNHSKVRFLFLNIGHFIDHYLLLIFATVAALGLTREWNLSYAELIPYATPGFIAFGVCAIPAGWLADRWSREGMMLVFFLGIGFASTFSAFANSPIHMTICLTFIGIFAAVYHPVGLAMVVEGRKKTGIPLAINGVFGNLGVASAALVSGFLIDAINWRAAFAIPGLITIAIGVAYFVFNRRNASDYKATIYQAVKPGSAEINRPKLLRVFAIVFFTTALGGLIFQSTTFSLPKVFDERLNELADSATLVGWYTFMVFALAAFAQLVVGHLVDNYPIRRIFLVVAVLQCVFLLAMTQLDGVLALTVAIAFMLAVFGQIPINDVLVGRMAKSEWRSRAYSFRYIVTFSVMASAVPFIAWIHGRWGFDVLFFVLAMAALLIFSAVLLLPGRIENG